MVTLKNLYKNNKSVLYALLAGIFGVLLAFVLIVNEEKKLKSDMNTLAEVKADLSNLDKLQADYFEKNDEVDKVLATFPSSYNDVLNYTNLINTIAAKNNLIIETKLDELAKKETSGGGSVGVLIETRGNYPQLREFVSNVSNLPYHITGESLSFENNEAGSVNMSYKFKIYINN